MHVCRQNPEAVLSITAPPKNNMYVYAPTHTDTTCSPHHCLCLEDFWWKPFVFLMPSFFQAAYNECLIQPPMALGEYDRVQPTRPQRPWNIHIQQMLSGLLFLIVFLSQYNTPAVTPSMRLYHINKGLPEGNPARFFVLATVLKYVCFQRGQSFSC